ncbi:MAG: tetratricopeptide repeat protein [Chitinophagales bacterium]|nr:tetratricopeptide repeat protein [Chitinophagales bacterium]
MSFEKKNKSAGKNGKRHLSSEKNKIPRAGNEKRNWIVIAIVVVTVILVYGSSLKNGFTNWDDEGYVLNNQLVKNIQLGTIFSSYVMGNYHPITVLVQAVEYNFFGETSFGYHVVSLLLHLLNSVLLFYFIYLLTGKKIAACIGSLIFGIHPLHVESVAWVSAQKDLLYVLFYLIGLLTYIGYSNAGIKHWRSYLIIICLYLLSLLSKAQAVTFPVVMVLIDWYRKRPINKQVLIEKLPFFIISVIFGSLAILAQKESSSLQDIKLYSLTDRLLFSAYGLISYLIKFILPVSLSAYYPYPEKSDGWYSWMVYAAPLFAVALFLFIFWKRKFSGLVFGMAFFLVNIFLVLQLLPVGGALVADRYSYLSYIGFCITIGVFADRIWSDSGSLIYRYRTGLAAVFVLWLFFLSYAASERTRIWKNSETLWTNVILNYPRVPIAYNDLGSYYQKLNELRLAKKNFDAAINLQPDFGEALINRCDLFRAENKIDSAIIDGNHAVKLRPENADSRINRGIAFSMAGKYDSAMADFNKAISLSPGNARYYNNRGNLFGITNHPDSAIRDYDLALRYDPGFIDAYGNRGHSYFVLGNYSQAINDLTKAIGSDSFNSQNYYIRMQAYEKSDKYREAFSDAESAKRLGLQIPDEYIQMLKQKY